MSLQQPSRAFCLLSFLMLAMAAPFAASQPAHAKKSLCGSYNQKACPKFFPGPQCKKGLQKIGKYCRKASKPPYRPGGPSSGASGKDSSIAKKVSRLAKAHAEQIRILRRFRSCMRRNKKALNKAARGRHTGKADQIKRKCLSRRDQSKLKRVNTRNNSGGSNARFRSLSVGLGADVAVFFGAGVDAGFVWDLDGQLPTRIFLSGASGGGMRAGGGADISVGINLDPNTSGVSKYYGGSVSGDAGLGVGVMVVTARRGNFMNSPMKGIEVSAGVGASFNFGSIDKIKTRIFRRSCRNVMVNVTNTGTKKIRILDLNYYDRGKRRSEPTPNRTVKPGKTRGVWKRPHNLGKVGYETTQLEVVYRYRGEKKTKRLPTGICRDGARYAISLP